MERAEEEEEEEEAAAVAGKEKLVRTAGNARSATAAPQDLWAGGIPSPFGLP